MNRKIVLSLLAGVVMASTASTAIAEKYLGNFCWQVVNENNQPFWKYNFGVYEKVGGHIALYGTIEYPPNTNDISASHGNAIIVGNNIKVTIVSSDYEIAAGEVWSETFNAILNATTLSGEWNALSLETNDGITVRTVYQKGSMSPIPCP